tara:strand:- start:1666 stop:1974 length:309 start_codon:yes stop_codon:yes gene_type:complete
MKKLFFHKIVKNTIIVKTSPSEFKEVQVGKLKKKVRVQKEQVFGLLLLTDDNGQTISPEGHGLRQNDLIPGIVLSDVPVRSLEKDPDTGMGKPTGMFWAQPE